MSNLSVNRQILEKIPLFQDLAPEDLAGLVGLLKKREFGKDEAILKQSELGNALYMIIEGQVKVVLYGDTGREIILSTLKDGDFFGEMALIDGAPRSASVIAQKSAKIMVLERADFIKQILENPDLGLKLLAVMSQRLREADEQIGTLALLDVYGRLARMLINLAERQGQKIEDGVLIEKRPTHQDIAAMIGTSRETVSRALGDFARRGMIDMSGKQIKISSVALRELEGHSGS